VPPINALIIDDSAEDRDLVKRALARAEDLFVVSEATTLEELEKLLRAENYDVVLSDYNILGLDGLTVLETVQTRQPDTPVILLTGTGSEEIAVNALKKGAADYVVKTVQHIKRLPSTISSVLERFRMGRERARLLEAIRVSEEKYRSLVDTAPEGIAVFDDRLMVTYWSRGAEKMFGYAAHEIVGTSATTLAPPAQRPRFAAYLWPTSRESIRSLTLARRDGTCFLAEVSLSSDGSAAVGGCTAVIRDVSEKDALETEIARLDRLAAVGEMVAGIAHEIRNPLAGIASSAATVKAEMERAGLDAEAATWIRDGVDKIEMLLRRFFDFAKPLDLRTVECDVRSLVSEALLLAPPGIGVLVEAGDSLPPVRGDRGLLYAVFKNAVTNACEAMPEGGSLTVKVKAVEKRGRVAVAVTFSDTGVGIPPEIAARLGEPFFTTKAQGVGLGLALTYKIAKAHGGDFVIAGREGGADATITLPACET
jgi:two-component system cell cycle sensor histidine kinase/response regulator CckA